ncbi:MAG: hypothetical protein MR605_00230 [Bacteroidales bacterium]|nr:hypothetical protein [Bacteroidales bacterium]MCI7050224.1 hypothetical protein [Bacteroidales bacterium]MDD6731760.1 hypothetical protein [Bacteroidales bacterium]MDY4557859.1 hypothetical protein [Alloprevotella sp.]
MANRKQLKKSIRKITGELFADCVALSLCQQADRDKLEQLMQEVLNVHNDYVARISHTEPGSVKMYYKKLKQEFTEKVNDLSERIIQA